MESINTVPDMDFYRMDMEKKQRLQRKCIIRCRGEEKSKDRYSCYSNCVFLNDFEECLSRSRGHTGISTYFPAFFGPEATKYGELPMYFYEKRKI